MAESSDLAVYVKGVYKQYGKGKKANHVLKGLDMEVPRSIMLVSVHAIILLLYYYYKHLLMQPYKYNESPFTEYVAILDISAMAGVINMHAQP